VGVRLIDDTGIVNFIDENGVQCFTDDLGNLYARAFAAIARNNPPDDRRDQRNDREHVPRSL
jgi:hypothetical protein